LEFEGNSTSEGLIDYKAECDKKDAIISDLKKKLGEYAKRTMVLINEKNELKRLLDAYQNQDKNGISNESPPLSVNTISSGPSQELLTPIQAGELMGINATDGEALVDYKGEVEKRDKIILEMDAKFKEYVKKTMKIINERNALKSELEKLKSKTQNLEAKEGKIEGIWKRKLMEAERKVRAMEKILEQKNKDLSSFQSRYIGELSEKDKKIQELVLKVAKLESDLKLKDKEN